MLNWLVCRSMENVEETCEQTAESGSKSVRVQIVVKVMGLAQEEDLVGGECDADGRVEASTELVSTSDAAQQGEDNDNGGADALSFASSVMALDHEDDADEDECAHDLIDTNIQVHV